ncbi:hypothetical protein V2O64_03510 [Verrucomicrobiaceae bacterium 227]
MFEDPKNPFSAAAPKDGAVPNPFQPALNGARPSKIPPSPFEVASSQSQVSEGQPEQAQQESPSPFGHASKIPEPRIAEPSEGFAMVSPKGAPESPAPSVLPQASPSGSSSSRNPFAASSSSENQVKLVTDAVLPAERTIPADLLELEDDLIEPVPRVSSSEQPSRPATQRVHGEMPQLVLRAIFGVTEELNKAEILERARNLPGIRNIQLVSGDEAKAMSFVRASIQRMGFGDENTMSLHTDAGTVDLIEESGTTLAVLHGGSYGAGVRETLIIVARELARLA